jgi:hypothetical protein
MEIKQPSGHLDQMIRQTRAHHVQLSQMADSKANMIMTVASILVPLSIQYLKIPQYRAAAMIMIGFCILTVVLSAYAALPKTKIKRQPVDLSAARNPSFNLLFFGAFADMNYAEFLKAMKEVMNSTDQTYEVQLREIYIMGQYLERSKYRFVRLSYLSFITGLIFSTCVYLVGHYFL